MTKLFVKQCDSGRIEYPLRDEPEGGQRACEALDSPRLWLGPSRAIAWLLRALRGLR